MAIISKTFQQRNCHFSLTSSLLTDQRRLETLSTCSNWKFTQMDQKMILFLGVATQKIGYHLVTPEKLSFHTGTYMRPSQARETKRRQREETFYRKWLILQKRTRLRLWKHRSSVIMSNKRKKSWNLTQFSIIQMSWNSFKLSKTLIDAGKSRQENWDKAMTRPVDMYHQALMTSCLHLTTRLRMWVRQRNFLKCIRLLSSRPILQIRHLLTKNHHKANRAQPREDGSKGDLLMLKKRIMMSRF